MVPEPVRHIYVMASNSRVLYTGITRDLRRRVYQHKTGADPGLHRVITRSTRLVYFETTSHIRAAIRREREIKSWRRSRKIELIEATNPAWLDLALGLVSGSAQARSLAALGMRYPVGLSISCLQPPPPPSPITLPPQPLPRLLSRRETDLHLAMLSFSCAPVLAAGADVRCAAAAGADGAYRGARRAARSPSCRITLVAADPTLQSDTVYAPYRDRRTTLLWADSIIGEAFTGRAPEVRWVLPPELRKLARRSPGDRRRPRRDGPGRCSARPSCATSPTRCAPRSAT